MNIDKGKLIIGLIYLFLIAVIIFFAGSCSTGKDIPQAEFATLNLISVDTVFRYNGDQYVFKWYDEESRIYYSVYTSKGYYSFTKGAKIIAVIRK